jgi:DNA-binding transcriptional LysR family regulator
MSTPPLSQRIRELEAALGVELFERTSRRVALTPAGEQLLVEARGVLDAMGRFDAAVAALVAAPATLTVGYCHGSEDGVMRTIGAMRTAHPEIVVRADGLTSLLILDGLRAGRVAVGVVRGPFVDGNGLTSVPLARVPVDHVSLPPGHRLARAEVIDVAELDGEPVLVVDRHDAPTAHDEIHAYVVAHDARPRWIEHAAVQVERVLDQVALGAGIGWLNSWQAARAGGRDDVVVQPLRPVGLYDDFRLAWRSGDGSSATAAFVELARAVCGNGVAV